MGKIIFSTLLFVTVITCTGCSLTESMTNDQIIEESKKCIDANMFPSQLINGINYKVRAVVCEPII